MLVHSSKGALIEWIGYGRAIRSSPSDFAARLNSTVGHLTDKIRICMSFSFLGLLSLVGDIVSIGDAAKRLFQNPERDEVEKYIRFLEPRKVIYAQIDQEIKVAVIASLEEIKRETEQLRVKIDDSTTRKSMSHLINVISDELSDLWAYDTIHRNGQIKMFMSLQRFRTELARTLGLLCHVYGISPASTELQCFIVNMATVRPAQVKKR